MSSSSGTSEISGTSDARDARTPRRVGVARAAAAFLLVAGALTACDAGRLTGPAGPDADGPAAAVSASLLNEGEVLEPITDPVDDTRSNQTLPYEGTEENRCNGDVVPVRGKVSYAFFVSDGDVTHQRVQFHWVVDGVSVGTNHEYHGSAQYIEYVNVSLLPMTQSFVHHVTMKSPDPTVPDLKMKFLFHLTISGSGTATATVEKGPTQECR